MAKISPHPIDRLICLMDSPPVLDCSVTAIPASGASPLQVVSFLPRESKEIIIYDGIGSYIGLYTGDVGSEQLRCVIAGDRIIPVVIPYGARVSLRSMSTQISTGTLCIHFLA